MNGSTVGQTKVSAKGWIVIPAELLHRYGLTPGTVIDITEVEGKIVLSPRTQASYKEARGMLPSEPSLTKELLTERAKDLGRRSKKRLS
jgi:AbrB family looped-hinge helix DNA binding protein